MEIREMKYFLMVANCLNISLAAKHLYITQPSLTRQMQNLEEEIGKKLFIRGKRHLELTETGKLFKKRCEEMLELYEKTTNELKEDEQEIIGDIHIGSAETIGFSVIAKVFKCLNECYPNVKLNITSGNSIDIKDRLDNGLIDFALFLEPFNTKGYEVINLNHTDRWGLFVKSDSMLATKDSISFNEIINYPLIISKQMFNTSFFNNNYKFDISTLNIKATYNLIFNATLLALEDVGYLVGLDNIIDNSIGNLKFIPFSENIHTKMLLCYKHNQVFSKASKLFIDYFKENYK